MLLLTLMHLVSAIVLVKDLETVVPITMMSALVPHVGIYFFIIKNKLEYKFSIFPEPITNAELEALGEEFFALEGPNNCGSLVEYNLQGKTSSGSNADLAPLPYNFYEN